MRDNPKTYSAPWQGQLILACRKCQKKLKGDPDLRGLAKLRTTVKRYNKGHPESTLHVINVQCMDLCPKDGVTVCDPRNPSRLMILRREADIRTICHAVIA